MIDLAAAGQIWRSSRSLVLLGATLILVSAVVLTMAVSEPSGSMAVNRAMCQHVSATGKALDPEQATELPFGLRNLANGDRRVVGCRFTVSLSADDVGRASLLVLSFTDSLEVEINGRRVALSQLNEMRQLRWVTLPTFVPLEPDVAGAGENQVRITIIPRLNGASMDRVFVGPRSVLRPYYQVRWFTSALLPTVLCGAELALAMVFGLIWAGRRGETAYAWLATLLFLGALHGSTLVPDFGISDANQRIWNLTVIWEALVCMLFLRAIVGDDLGRRNWLFVIPPAAISVAVILENSPHLDFGILVTGSLTILAALLLGVWSLVRASLRGNRNALIMCLGIAVVIIFLSHDLLMIFGVVPGRTFVGRIGMAGFLITVSTLMTLRFIRAMREVDRTADDLRQRVAAAEAELRVTYEELRVRREAEAIERERSRLMRDLHDGIGGELASMLALADSPKPRSAEIASHARAALSDMRLIISSLEDYGGDLALALGAWRERAAPQVRAAGLKLDWRVDDLPPIANLGPAQVLDILRIVQEAVTNVIKHAEAKHVVLEARADADSLTISVRDDGTGTISDTRGHGLRNMAERAARLGAALDITRNGEGTEVLLRIPRVGDEAASPAIAGNENFP